MAMKPDTARRQINEALADPSVTYRAKRWMQEALAADPVDAVHDARLVLELMEDRMFAVLGQAPDSLRK